MILLKNNVYDKLLFILISSLIFGGIGGGLRPVRLLILLFVPVMFKVLKNNKKIVRQFRFEILFFLFWFLYAISSLSWAIDFKEGVQEILYLMVNFIGYLMILTFAKKANHPKKIIKKAWIFIFIFSLPIAVYELLTHNHLYLNSIEHEIYSANGSGELRRYASVTFGNLNTYNLMLTYILPFVCYSLISSHRKKNIFLILVTLSITILINSSRAALFCLVIAFLIYIFSEINSKKNRKYIYYFFGVFFFLFVRYYNFIFDNIIGRLSQKKQNESSNRFRFLMIKKGFKALSEYDFFGVGAGNFTSVLKNHITEFSFYTAHNFLLEILVQYGLLIFVLFLILLKKNIYKKQFSKSSRFVKRYFICTFLIIITINSNYIRSFHIWAYMATIFVVLNLNKHVDYE